MCWRYWWFLMYDQWFLIFIVHTNLILVLNTDSIDILRSFWVILKWILPIISYSFQSFESWLNLKSERSLNSFRQSGIDDWWWEGKIMMKKRNKISILFLSLFILWFCYQFIEYDVILYSFVKWRMKLFNSIDINQYELCIDICDTSITLLSIPY